MFKTKQALALLFSTTTLWTPESMAYESEADVREQIGKLINRLTERPGGIFGIFHVPILEFKGLSFTAIRVTLPISFTISLSFV